MQISSESASRHQLQRRRRRARVRPLLAASRGAEAYNSTTPPPFIHVMKYVVPTLLVFVTLKYQAKPECLFKENLAPVWCFLAVTSVYWITLGIMKQTRSRPLNRKYLGILSGAAIASSLLSAASAVSMFLPYPVSLAPIIIILILLPVALALPSAYKLLTRGAASVADNVQASLPV